MDEDRFFVNDLQVVSIDDHEGRLAFVREILKAAAVALKVLHNMYCSHLPTRSAAPYRNCSSYQAVLDILYVADTAGTIIQRSLAAVHLHSNIGLLHAVGSPCHSKVVLCCFVRSYACAA